MGSNIEIKTMLRVSFIHISRKGYIMGRIIYLLSLSCLYQYLVEILRLTHDTLVVGLDVL